MNHLGHLALAGEDAGLLTGGLLGDFVKGPLRGERPPTIERGIALHRAIDAFSNRLVPMQASARRFGDELRRVSPVLIDIVADHFLAQFFDAHHGLTLEQFASKRLPAIEQHREWLPYGAERLFRRLIGVDGLRSHGSLPMTVRAMSYVLDRVGRRDATPLAVERFERQYDAFRQDFSVYYPELQSFAQSWVHRN